MDKLFLKEKHLNILKNIFDTLCPNVVVTAYGSRIKGLAHDGSDLDLAILTPLPEGVYLYEIEEAINNSDLPFLVDIFEFEKLPENFKQQILKKNIVIYGGQNDPGRIE